MNTPQITARQNDGLEGDIREAPAGTQRKLLGTPLDRNASDETQGLDARNVYAYTQSPRRELNNSGSEDYEKGRLSVWRGHPLALDFAPDDDDGELC
jgi:hypothetical protein